MSVLFAPAAFLSGPQVAVWCTDVRGNQATDVAERMMNEREAVTPEDRSETVGDPATDVPVSETTNPRSGIIGGMATIRDGAQTGVADLVRKRFVPNLRRYVTEREAQVWAIALLIGVSVGFAALGFRFAIGAIQWLWLGTMAEEQVATAARQLHWSVVLLVPTVGGLLVGQILERYMPGRRAHGVADVIEAQAIRDCNIPIKEGFLSAGIAALSLGTGNSAGREGPVVHLGATLASLIENYTSLGSTHRRTLLACGVGAAVSASFNAPIAGVLFAHEVILAHFAMSAFVPIVIASVAGTLIVRWVFGDNPAFLIPNYEITSVLEFPAFALLGAVCALVAIIFQSSLIVTERAAWSVRIPLWLRPAIGGALVGMIALVFPEVLGVGYEATNQALQQDAALGIGLMIALLAAKTAATSITIASRFGGGIFSPSLYLGAMTGGAFGLIAASVFPDVASSGGLYAILGMGAVASAVLGAPISTAMVVFELTGGYAMTIALLVTVAIANGLTHAVHGESFFHWQLGTRGLFLHEGPHQAIMRRMLVRGFMTPLKDDEVVEPISSESDVSWILASDTMDDALRQFDRTGRHRLAVVESRDLATVIGWADHITALHAFNDELIDSHREEHR
ncbi:MAG: chloride channel protein [Pseudomonadota bacterium]